MDNVLASTTDFGWRFPPTFSLGGKGIEKTWGDQDLQDSLGILLATRPGEHPIYPDFGCSLEDFMFQQMDQNMINIIQHRISRSIRKYEQRIDLESVDVEPDEAEGKLIIRVNYIIKATGQSTEFTSEVNLFP